VRDIDALIDDGHYDVRTSLGDVPGSRRVDLCQSILVDGAKELIIWQGVGVQNVIRLCVKHVGLTSQRRHRLKRLLRQDAHETQARNDLSRAKILDLRRDQLAIRSGDNVPSRSGSGHRLAAIAHEDLARLEFGARAFFIYGTPYGTILKCVGTRGEFE
jgi:hypothetical protein